MAIDQLALQRLEEMVDELRDLNRSISPQYGGSNIHFELNRIGNELSLATYEFSRIAMALEKISKALIE